MNREQHNPVYDTPRHRAWRRRVLRQHPVCPGWPPGSHGPVAVASTVADHLVPLKQGGTWALSNGQGLCAACHAAKTNDERGYLDRKVQLLGAK